MDNNNTKHTQFDNKLLIIGFGSIGQAVLPLILRHIQMKPAQITIMTKKSNGANIADEYGVNFIVEPVTKENYVALLAAHLREGDFLLNLSVDVSSIDLIKYCQANNILYLDTCIEPWEGGYVDETVPSALRSNYALREAALMIRKNHSHAKTAVITHGANPGLVSYFVKQALLNIARDNDLDIDVPTTQSEWALLSQHLGIKVIHVAECDTQTSLRPKRQDEFVNTWSIDGFVSEGSQPAELGWGTHEQSFPPDARHHDFGCRSAIYLNRPGASTRVRTWTPLAGSFHGFLITHSEAISISDYLTLKADDMVVYRPTVHYAYLPCEDAVLSLHELAGREWNQQQSQCLLTDEIVDGVDELGVLLMGNKKGAYWFGSRLSIHEARELAPYNTATSLQVAAGVLGGMVYAMLHPNEGVIEPDQIDFNEVMKIARPYLGTVSGHYTDWTPLKDRSKLFPETIDITDPWQFVNIRVK